MAETPGNLPDFVNWPSFPFTGDMRLKPLLPQAGKEPPRQGEDPATCHACAAPDEAYIWVSERWRVRAMERPTGLPMVLILESRSHLDLGDLPNLLAAELGVMTVRLERAIRSLDGVARVHVNRWGDGSAHLHLWFLARPFGYLQLRGSFLSLWDDILPPIPEETWRENLAMIAAWLAEFGGRPLAEPPRIDWQAPASVAAVQAAQSAVGTESAQAKAPEPGQGKTSEAGQASVAEPGQGGAPESAQTVPAATAGSGASQDAPTAPPAPGQATPGASNQGAPAPGAPAQKTDLGGSAPANASAAPAQAPTEAAPTAVAASAVPAEGATAAVPADSTAGTSANAPKPPTRAGASGDAAPAGTSAPATSPGSRA